MANKSCPQTSAAGPAKVAISIDSVKSVIRTFIPTMRLTVHLLGDNPIMLEVVNVLDAWVNAPAGQTLETTLTDRGHTV